MTLKPLADRVVVKLVEAEETTKTGKAAGSGSYRSRSRRYC